MSHDPQTGEVMDLPEDIDLHKIAWSKPRKNILMAMLTAQRALKPAEKDCYNKHIDSKYAGLESVMAAYTPFLDAGILLTQSPITKPDGEVVLVTELTHVESEEWCRTVISCRPNTGKNALHDLGGTITYLRRYGIPPVTGIVAGEDNDGNHAERHEQQNRQRDQRRQEDGLATEEDLARFQAKFKELAAERFATEKEARVWLKEQEPNLNQAYARRLRQVLGMLSKRPILQVEGKDGKPDQAEGKKADQAPEDPKRRGAAQQRWHLLFGQKGLSVEEASWWAGRQHNWQHDPEKDRPSAKLTPLPQVLAAITELSKLGTEAIDGIKQSHAEHLEDLRIANEEAEKMKAEMAEGGSDE